MGLGKIKKDKSLEEQLAEIKKKEAEMLKKIEEEKEAARKQAELDAQIEKERKLLEEKKAHEEFMRKEAEKVKEKERQQQEKAKQQAILEKKKQEIEQAKEALKDHPDGCRCGDCAKIRDDEKSLEQTDVKIFTTKLKPDSYFKQISTETKESGFLPEKSKSKFSVFSKLNKPLFKKEKPSEDIEKEAEKDMKEYHKVNKNPNALFSFISSKKNRIKASKLKKENNKIAEEIDAQVHPSKFTDITVLGLRLAVGVAFIMHGLSKMDNDGQMFIGMLQNWGMPPELAFPIALAELLAGIFLTVGFLTRISSAMIGVIMLGAIFHVKGASSLIGQGGVELDLIILAVVALLGMFGPGRLSVANIGIKGMIFDRKLQ